MEQAASQGRILLLSKPHSPRELGHCVTPTEQTTCGHTCISQQQGSELPGVAVGGQALPGLHTAAGHGEGSPTAAVQLHEQCLGRILSRLPAVMSPLEHLSDVFIP